MAIRILLTGGTGFLGSHLLAGLLRRRYPVTVLARSKGAFSARQRIGLLLDWLGIESCNRTGLEVLEGCIDQVNFGLSCEIYSKLIGRFHSIIHAASDTSFSERKRAAVEQMNIHGLQNMLELASHGCRSFHYISTAYSAGKRVGRCEEKLLESVSFHNVYEESKHRAEHLAWEHCRREGIRLSIYRPSIVYGDSVTGRTFRFNALYYPIKVVLFLKNIFETDIREHGGLRAREMGVHANGKGSLSLPISIETVEGGGINLVPIDYFVQAFEMLFENCPQGGIFHLVNHRRKPLEDLIEYIQAYFHLEGLRPCRMGKSAPRNPLERLFDSYLAVYAPYMKDTRTFENESTRTFLEGGGIVCPEFDNVIFSRCLEYALASNWEKNFHF